MCGQSSLCGILQGDAACACAVPLCLLCIIVFIKLEGKVFLDGTPTGNWKLVQISWIPDVPAADSSTRTQTLINHSGSLAAMFSKALDVPVSPKTHNYFIENRTPNLPMPSEDPLANKNSHWGCDPWADPIRADGLIPKRRRKRCLVYHSQHKSGGSTFEQAMEKYAREENYSTGSCEVYNVAKSLTCGGGPLGKPKKEHHMVTGGYVLTLVAQKQWQRDKCVYFSVFREPISRLVSSYAYCKYLSRPDPLCGFYALSPKLTAKTFTLQLWAKHWGNYLFRDLIWYTPLRNEVEPPLTEASMAKARATGKRDPTISYDWYVLKKALKGGDDPRTDHGKANLDRTVAYLKGSCGKQSIYDTIGILERWADTMAVLDHDVPMSRGWERLTAHHEAHGSEKYKTEEKKTLRAAWNDSFIQSEIAADINIYKNVLVPMFEARFKMITSR